jgi:hypothetical protein
MSLLNNIYKKFRSDMNNIKKYLTLTSFSYELSRFQFLKDPAKYEEYINSTAENQPEKQNELTDSDIAEPCKWITIDEYAEKEQITISEIKEQIRAEMINYATLFAGDKFFLIWPPEYQNYPLNELPDIHDQIFKITSNNMYTQLAEYDKSEENIIEGEKFLRFLEEKNVDPIKNSESIILNQISRLGSFNDIFTEVKLKLYSSSFLLAWIAFEDFINATIIELYRSFPEKVLTKKYNKDESLKLLDVFRYSNNFSEIDSLANYILTILLNKEEQSHQGIHSKLVFLKKNFLRNIDIYKAPIYIDEEKTTTSFTDIEEFRKVRNHIVHDNSFATVNFFIDHPRVPKEDNKIIITARYLDIFTEIIQAISYYAYSTINEIS